MFKAEHSIFKNLVFILSLTIMFVCPDFRVIFVFIFVSEITYFMPGTVYSKD